MHQYLQDTRFAAKGLVGLIAQDAADYAALQDQHAKAAAKEAYYHAAFRHREMGPDANYWHARHQESGMALIGLAAELSELENSIVDKRQSVSALSGALLQIAKQGISSVHKRPDNCPNGRKVFGIDIKWLIWAGRNQAVHYENPADVRQKTQEVFAGINSARSLDDAMDPLAQINWAYEVVGILGWIQYERYEADMISLLG